MTQNWRSNHKKIKNRDLFHTLVGTPLLGINIVLLALCIVTLRALEEAVTFSTPCKGASKPDKGKKADYLDPIFLKTTK